MLQVRPVRRALLKVLAHYDEVMDIMLPSPGRRTAGDLQPFLPVCPETGVVLQVPILERNVEAGTIISRRRQAARSSSR